MDFRFEKDLRGILHDSLLKNTEVRRLFTARQTLILRYLLEQDDYTSYASLAKRLSISSRTLMREMDALKPELKRAKLSVLSKKGAGFMIVGSVQDKQAFLARLENGSEGVQDKNLRRMLLGVDLLKAREAEKLLYYADRYQVSEATISKDLDLLEDELDRFGVHLVRRPGYGIEIAADETSRRQSLSWLSNEALAMTARTEGFNRYSVRDVMLSLTDHAASSLGSILNPEILEGILQALQAHEEELELGSMAAASYVGLIIHLVIAIDRLQKHIQVENGARLQELVSDDAARRKASIIGKALHEQFGVDLNPAEEAYIAIHLQSAKAALSDGMNDQENIDLIYAMLMVFRKAGYNLFSDAELLQSLSAHLGPALARLRCELPITNPLLGEIRSTFPDLYGISLLAAQAVSEKTGLIFNADEAGFLTLHFAAAIERLKARTSGKIRVAVVCASGIGLSSLLCSRLRHIADRDVEIKAMSAEQAEAQQMDLIVSSFSLPGALQVSPMLKKEDEAAFSKAVASLRESGTMGSSHVQSSLDVAELVNGLNAFLESIQIIDLDQADTVQDAIHDMAAYVQPDPGQAALLEQSVLAREAMASNLYPELQLALFHAALPALEKPVLVLARPKSSWQGEMNDIRLAVLMAMRKSSPRWMQEMLSGFSAMLIEDPQFFENLCTMPAEEARRQIEKQYQSWLVRQLKKIDL